MGTGKVGVVLVALCETEVPAPSSVEDESGASADRRPVSLETSTPIATAARMIKTKANPHCADECESLV